MAISLSKGQAISLAKFGSKYELRAGWDKAITGRDMDLDIMALLCDGNERALPTDTCLIFYNFLKSLDGAVEHTGDERTGSKQGWDEIIKFDFKKLSSNVNNIILILNIDKAMEKGQNFGLVRNLKLELFDIDNKEVTATFEPDLTNSTDTALILGVFKIKDKQPYFKAVGEGRTEGLDVILKGYGANVE